MEIRYGLISCDSHGQLDRDAFTSRMSQAQWGDRIPHVQEFTENGKTFDRWVIDGKRAGGLEGSGVVNCPAAMPGGTERRYYPARWEEVPRKVYDPVARLTALDEDRTDAEVLFPNPPSTFGEVDPEFDLACTRAYNEALADWTRVSDRYIPIAILPHLSPVEVQAAEVERAVRLGARGINMVAEPSLAWGGAQHLGDRAWDPLWHICEELGIPINWHGSAGLAGTLAVPRWNGYSPRQFHTASTSRLCSTPAQLLPFLFFSGILDRFPRLKWACAETGMGWMAYVLERCDYEWEQRQLWKEGVLTRPSEAFRRQVYVDFWFEQGGVELRHMIGIDNIMWESDYPHITSTFPDSWEYVERTLQGVPEEEREKMLFMNAMRLYGLESD